MKEEAASVASPGDEQSSELLILPDGRILAHNLTPVMASVLTLLNPEDDTIKSRLATQSK